MAGSSSYGALPGTWTHHWSPEWCAHRCYEPATVPCNSLYMYDHPWCWFSLQCNTMAGAYTGWWMVPLNLQDHSWFRKKCFPLPNRIPVDGSSGSADGIRSESHTKFGRYTIAIGSNKEAAALSGINVKFYHVMVYVVCGLFVGLAAIAYAAVTPTVQPGTGAGLEMDAIGGVFVGGVAATGGYGSVIGTFVGIFVIMLLKTGLPYVGLQANWQQIITGLVLIVAVLIDIIKEKKKAAM